MFSSLIINWYNKNLRFLPWRETQEPYLIWISEVILQQTRVAQGLPYYNKFILAFPTIEELANATEQEVLASWQGLGYYSRARNMHKCAKTITLEYSGIFPDTFEKLLKLPGIGPYTAAAIASLSFNIPVPVVDGNVFRVLARVFGLKNNIADAKSFRIFFNLSKKLIDQNKPGIYNQSVMELGATICLPHHPKCEACPLSQSCFAFTNNLQSELPIKIKHTKRRNRYFYYLVIEIDHKIALYKRTKKDIWEGLFEFYMIENEKQVTFDELEDQFLKNLIESGAIVENDTLMPKHILSHQTIFSSFLHICLSATPTVSIWLQEKELILYELEEIENLPKSVLITNYLNCELK